MATNIPTVEEFNEELPVSSWDRNTVADGNWLQANTIGPLKNRDDKIIELLQDLEGASNSWKNWSEDHDTDVEGDNNYYIGSGNSAHGNSIIIGNGNESDSTSLLVKKHLVESRWDSDTQRSINTYATDAIYSAQNFIVGNNNIAKTTRNAFIFGSNNYTETTEKDLDLDCDPNDDSTKGQDNDGYTLAFGLANSAIRNYDIAIGRGVLASGGENIVIGAPKCCGNSYTEHLIFDTKSVGYRNINVRSDVDGHMNIAFESVVSGYPFSANGSNCGPGLNVLYHSNVTYSGKPGTLYNTFDHNNFDDCSKFIVDFRDYGSPIVSNIFKHVTDLTFKNTQNSSFPGICYNDFFNLRYVNFSGTGKLNRNVLRNIEKLNLSGEFFNNYFDNLDNYSTETITVSQASNNIFKHFNGQVDFSARQLDNNIILHAAYNSRKFDIGAPIIHGNVFNEISFDGYIGDTKQCISAYGLDDACINYNILYNVNSIKNPIILPKGYFLNNIMTNTYGMYLSGYNHINNNIFNNISFSAGSKAVDDEHGDGIINENIFLNSYDGQYTDNKLIFNKITHINNNTIIHSDFSASFVNANTQYLGDNAEINSNIILHSKIRADLYSTNDDRNEYFIHNFIFNGELTVNSARPVLGNSYTTFSNNPTQNNVLFNTKAVNSYGSFAFGDGFDSYWPHRRAQELKNCNSVQILGQSYAEACVQCGIFGTNNYLASGERSFIIGEGNELHGSRLGYHAPVDNENIIIGINNNLSANTETNAINGVITRNILIGKNNAIYAVHTNGNPVCDNYLIGFGNAFGTVNDSYNRFDTNSHEFHNKASSADQVQRNFFVGSYNIASKQVNDSFIFGARNAIRYNKDDSDTENDTIISNNFIIGANSLSIAGSNQFNAGLGNITSGYFSMAIGEDLIANESQLVIGRFNTAMPGTNGISADDINSTSGALFVIGNGRHQLTDSVNGSYKEEIIERSNAMVVSADGTVSARTYKADPNSPLGKLFDFISSPSFGTGNLHWDATTSAWSMQ